MYEVARKEVLQHLRTKRIWIVLPLFLAAMVIVTIVFPMAILREEGLRDLGDASPVPLQNLVLLFFLSGFFFLSGYFYLQLIPILITADSVCSEWSNRTIFLLLSKPVSRTAFVLGKFAGSCIVVVAVVFGALLLDYLFLQVLLPGTSDGEAWGRFLGAMGILLLGGFAYASLALLFSTLTRTTVTANILAITSWIIAFPLLSRIDLLVAIFRHGIEGALTDDPSAVGIGWSQYLSPGDSMRAASDVLVPDVSRLTGTVGNLFGVASGANPGLAVLALCIHIALYLGLALLVVRRRNFE